MRFSFLHAADLHLDRPFRGVRRTPPTVSELLQDAALEVWEALVDLALERRVSFVVLAGDIVRGGLDSLRAQAALRTGLERLAGNGIPTFACLGADDPAESFENPGAVWPGLTTSSGALPSGFSILAPGGAEIAATARDGHIVAALRTARPDDPAFVPADLPQVDASLRIALLRPPLTTLEPSKGAAFSRDALGNAGVAYWAIGSSHAHRVDRSDTSWIVCAGTPQGRSPDPCDAGPKGAVIAHAENDRIERVEFVEVDRVRFVDVSVEIEPGATADLLASRLAEALEPVRREHPGRSLIVRGELRAASGMRPGALADAHLRAEILRRLRRGAEGTFPVVWWNELCLHAAAITRGEAPSEDDTSFEDFASDFHAVVEAYGGASIPESEDEGESDADRDGESGGEPRNLDRRIGLSWSRLDELAIGAHLAPLDDASKRAILRDAEREAIAALEKELEE